MDTCLQREHHTDFAMGASIKRFCCVGPPEYSLGTLYQQFDRAINVFA
jgi:hypothetical protein